MAIDIDGQIHYYNSVTGNFSLLGCQTTDHSTTTTPTITSTGSVTSTGGVTTLTSLVDQKPQGDDNLTYIGN